ncbi:hypothetical protein [Streptomyces sp. I05A-00742]|uniref:hypothetical protein n=1 Tax=Streptomyces sp. I05A-00742 TaxID=2732853 RepID=UPI00201763CE|nr:hypothetical protein [Streptomyces sp. I05A-00742]
MTESGAARGSRTLSRWPRELCMGARYAGAGGREGLLRTALTAVGIGLGVALLLITASIPSMLSAREARLDDRAVATTGEFRDHRVHGVPRSPDTLLYLETGTDFRDKPVTGGLLRPDGPDAPRPPGVDRMPGTGEMVVSPALDALLSSDRGALLRERFTEYRKIGTIGDRGLVGPCELFYYAGDDRIDEAMAPCASTGSATTGPTSRSTP